ncbi:MAG: carbon-nitrogen hydrolase family protein [Dehalobacterium sp.]
MSFKVGGVQLGPFSGDLDSNFKKITNYIAEAERLDIKILCFPELCTTPYFPKFNDGDEGKWFFTLNDHRVKKLIDDTKDKNLTVIFPFAEKSDTGNYNSAIVFKMGKVMGKYRKNHIPILKSGTKFDNYEEKFFKNGNLGFPVFSINGIKAGIQICFDRHFPEGFRILTLKGSRLIFLATNSCAFDSDPVRIQMWERLLQVRAYENGVYIIAVNKAGVEDGWDFMGRSMVVDPNGRIIKRLDKEENIFFVEINQEELHKQGMFISKRTPANYQELADI